MAKLGLDWGQVPRIEIRQEPTVGWRKLWTTARTYIVSLPLARGHRSSFKKAYRECLASVFLEELRRQDPKAYKVLVRSVGRIGFGRGKKVRQVLTEIIRKGSQRARRDYKKMSRYKSRKKGSKVDLRYKEGQMGVGVCDALKASGFSW